jgi:hypothetical protein
MVRSVCATACLLATTALFADQPPHYDGQTTEPAVGERTLQDNEAWFTRLFASPTESPSDRTVPQFLAPRISAVQEADPQIRPRVVPRDNSDSPPTVQPTIDDAGPQPPDRAAPDTAAPIVDTSDLAPANERRVSSFRQSRASRSFARRRRRIAVLGDSLIDAGQLNLQF